MNRAARRRAARQPMMGDDNPIQLVNPVANQFPAFITGNAVAWERMAAESLEQLAPTAWADLASVADDLTTLEVTDRFRALLREYPAASHLAQQGSAAGQHLVLCGAGPSLADHAAEWVPHADQVWGCNSAVTWLAAHGHPVTHGFTVDQTPHMLEEWISTPDVEYLLATSCHPHLVELLTGRGRRIIFFHNYCGVVGPNGERAICTACYATLPRPKGEAPGPCPHTESEGYEDWLYGSLFGATIRCGAGLNSVNRAIDLAVFMGFDRITVLGADCALRARTPCPPDARPGLETYRKWLREEVTMHADGGNPLAAGASEMTLSGVIDGRTWVSKPDMLVSAVHLVDAMRANAPGRLTFIGDTLVNAIKDKPESFLKRLPTMVGNDGKPIRLRG